MESAIEIDVHTHFFPAGLADLAERTGDARWPSLAVRDGAARIMRGTEVFRPVASTCWNVADRVAALDQAGVAHQVLSPVPVTLVGWAEPGLAAPFLRAQNDALAEAVASAPERFSALGAVPLQDVELAIAELDRVMDELGFVGIEIGTTVNGVELDALALRPFFAAAEAKGAALFIHPTDGEGAIRRRGAPYEFGLGMLTDTAMAATALVFGGVLDAHPDLRIGLAHGCGSFAWAYPRLARGASIGAEGRVLGSTDELVRSLWVDSLVFEPTYLPVLFDRFGDDHVMVGSDFPFYPAAFGGPADIITQAMAMGCCSDHQARAVLGGNARAFLGGVTSAGASPVAPSETGTPTPG